MKDKFEIVRLQSSDKEFEKIINDSFSESPQIPFLIKKPGKTGKFMKNLIKMYDSTGKVKIFGLKENDNFLCCGYCVDSDAKIKLFDLLKFGLNSFLFVGFRGLRELYQFIKNKPKYDIRYFELLLLGTLPGHQKKGLGKIMLNFLYDYVKKNNYAGVICVTNKSLPAYRFYKREGWIDDLIFKIGNYEFSWLRK